MSTPKETTPAAFTPGERDYIRRELDRFFSTLPSVADGFQLRTWRGGAQAGRPLWLTLNRLDTEQTLARQFVLSVMHGLLVAEAPIGNYDLKLTPARADELVLDPAHLARSLGSLRCNAKGAVEVCVVGGALYVETGRRLVRAAQERGILAPGVVFTAINDQIGMMRRRMASWLTGNSGPADTPAEQALQEIIPIG